MAKIKSKRLWALRYKSNEDIIKWLKKDGNTTVWTNAELRTELLNRKIDQYRINANLWRKEL